MGLSYLLAFGQGEWVRGLTIEAGSPNGWPIIYTFLRLPAFAMVLLPRRSPS